MQQSHHMILVASEALGLSNFVDNHIANFVAAVLSEQEGGTEPLLRQLFLREMLVLCDGEHFFFS